MNLNNKENWLSIDTNEYINRRWFERPFEVIQAIHELPFDKGLDRVCTNIRIDDRRDKSRKMNDKLKSVQNI